MRLDAPEHINQLADRIERSLPDELREIERDLLRRAFLTLAFRFEREPMGHRCKRVYTR